MRLYCYMTKKLCVCTIAKAKSVFADNLVIAVKKCNNNESNTCNTKIKKFSTGILTYFVFMSGKICIKKRCNKANWSLSWFIQTLNFTI